jgi:hypothetical protein
MAGNTKDPLADEREKLVSDTNESADDEVEAHARYAGNANESAGEDDEVEAHMRRLPPTS